MMKYIVKAFIVLIVFLSFNHPMVAQVFNPVKWSVSVENVTSTEASLLYTATIEKGWSMYDINVPEGGPIPTSFTFEPNSTFELINKIEQITQPEIKQDATFKMQIGQFKGKAVFRQKVKIKTDNPFDIKTVVEYMCCDDKSCLSPVQTDLMVTVTPTKGESTQTTNPSIATFQPTSGEPLIVPDDPIVETAPALTTSTDQQEESSSLWLFFLRALLEGFAGILMPCVYPMIPITVSFFLRNSQSRSGGIIKALSFGFSIILIYTLVGVIVAITKQAGITNQITGHWLVNLIFAALFIVFALSFFGLFEIALPSSLANKIDQKADKGGYLSAFFMALALVVVSFSCTGVFIGDILVNSAKGLAVKPIVGMFAFGLAFALPFTLLAIFPSLMQKMPKSGGWMNNVKIVFAFLMLASALYFLMHTDKALNWHLISFDVYLCIWIVLAAFMGLYLLGKIRFAHDNEVSHIGVVRLFLSIASFVLAGYLFTGLLGAPLNAISGLLPETKQIRTSAMSMPESSANYLCGTPKYSDILTWPHGLQGYFDLDEAMACAKQQNKPMLVIFKGHACAKCRAMESTVWLDPAVKGLMRDRFILLALYTDDNTPLPENEHVTSTFDGKIKKTMGQKNVDYEITRYSTNTQPYHVILTPNGEIIGQPIGYTENAEEFYKFLEIGLNGVKSN